MSEETEASTEVQRAPRPNFLTKIKFEDFDLTPDILAGLDEAGYSYCTPIQAEVLPVSLTGHDVAGQAQTGTGKTAAFLVTIFARLLGSRDAAKTGPFALIIAPTRELAMQVYEDAQVIGKYTKLTMALAIGGIEYQEQAQAIRNNPDIIICTPGRIIDYLKQKVFNPQNIQMLVIDEADRLFDLGFVKDLRFLLKRLPPYEKRQSMLFSATLSYRVMELTYDYMNLPEFISITPDQVAVDAIDQSLIHVGQDEKLPLLLGILEREDWTSVLIFVNTKYGVEWLAQKLKGNGLPAEGISGDLPQRKRLQLMERFKDGRIRILVATDVASRGIHVEDISHVINYDLPQDVENYVHRIGRTARAGKTGRAISFACENYVFHLEPLEEMLGKKIPVVWPDADWVKEDKAGHVHVERNRRDNAGGSRSRGRDGRDQQRGRGRDDREPSKDRGRDDREPSKDRSRSDRSQPRDRGRGDRDQTRSAPPAPKRKRSHITRPGGIFGLAPASRYQTAADTETEEKARKKAPTPRPKPKAEPVAAEDTLGRNLPLGPDQEMEAENGEQPNTLTDSNGPQPETVSGSEEEPKKKKRRRRRKKKSPVNNDMPTDVTETEDHEQ
jgi:ATP-dependent RNA helicase RhlB